MPADPSDPSDYDLYQNNFFGGVLVALITSIQTLTARVVTLEETHDPPAGTLTVGSGGTYATIAAAWAAASNDATIELVSNVSEPNGQILGDLDGITIDLKGFTVTHTGTPTNGADGTLFRDCVGTRVISSTTRGAFVNDTNIRSETYGAGVIFGPGAVYWLVENVECSYYIQAGVNTSYGGSPAWSRHGEGAEYGWINDVYVHDIDVNSTFNDSGSCLSILLPQPVSATAPAWWQTKIDDEIGAVPPQTPVARSWDDCVFIITNCDLRAYNEADCPTSDADTDANGIILDEWRDSFTSGQGEGAHSYPPQHPGAWAFIANNTVYDVKGAGVRAFNNADAGYDAPHVIVHNTIVTAGKRLYDPAFNCSGTYTRNFTSSSCVISTATGYSATLGYTPNYQYNALVANNLMVDVGTAIGEQWGLTEAVSNVNLGNNIYDWNDSVSGAPGIRQSQLNPDLSSLTDPTDFIPTSGSPMIGAGANILVPNVDKDGNTRPQPPTIGAYEPT